MSLSGSRQDVRLTLRRLVRRPVFTAVVILTLGLGVGACTASFSVMNAVILAPLPFRDPDRVVQIYESYPKGSRYHPGSEQGFITVRRCDFEVVGELSKARRSRP